MSNFVMLLASPSSLVHLTIPIKVSKGLWAMYFSSTSTFATPQKYEMRKFFVYERLPWTPTINPQLISPKFQPPTLPFF